MEAPYDCDILLYRGTGLISRAIQRLDGTDVSHAGLYLAPEGEVAEALFDPGLTTRPLAESVSSAEWVRVRRLKTAPYDMTPVRECAEAYLASGSRYAYEQIILLAFLCLTRKARLAPGLRLMARAVLDTAASIFTSLAAAGREPMICSEFVYRSYDEAVAGAGDQYSIGILPQGAAVRGSGMHPGSLLDWYTSAGARSWDPTLHQPVQMLPADPAASDPTLEEAVELYLEQAALPPEPPESVRMRSREPDVTDQELRESIESFSVSLLAATQTTDDVETARMLDTPLSVAEGTRGLLQVVADFVTPGDLFQSIDLEDMGDVK